MPLPISRENHFPTPPDHANRAKLENQERLPSQAAEDWLFAYANARNYAARETMWPHLVESIETLIIEFRQMHDRQMGKDLNG